MEERKSFTFYRSFIDCVKKQDPTLRLEVLEAIINYALDGELPKELSEKAEIILTLVRPIIDSNIAKAKGGAFGFLGGRPRKEENPMGSEDETLSPIRDKNIKNKNKDIDKNNIAEEESSAPSAKKKIAVTRTREYKIEQVKSCAHALGYTFEIIKNPVNKCKCRTAKGVQCEKYEAVNISGDGLCLQHAQQMFGLMYDIKYVYTFISQEYQNIMWTWLSYKHDRKEDYASKASVQALYNKLLSLSEGNANTAREIVEQSMANNWAGIFPLKNPTKPKSNLVPLTENYEEDKKIGFQV